MAGGQFQTVAIPKRLQLVAPPGYRSNNANLDSQLINCFAEKDPYDGEYWVQKRPCFGNELLVPTSSGVNQARGIYRYQGYNGGNADYIFLVANNSRLNRVNQTGTAVANIGNISANTANYSFETVRATPNYLAVLNDAGLAYYTDGVTVTDMTALANFPAGTVRGWAYLDGTLYVMTGDNRIYGSANLDDPSVWSLLNVIVARNGSDRSVALTKHKEYVMALKENSSEFFYNAGNAAGSPLSPLRGSKIPYGCANAYTVQSIDDETVWMSRGENGIFQVIRLTNLRPTVVSNPPIERLLRTYLGGTGFDSLTFSYQLKIGGHRFYGLRLNLRRPAGFFDPTAVSTDVTLIYDLGENLWYRWTDTVDTLFGFLSWKASGFAGPDSNQKILMQHIDTGNIHAVYEDYVQVTDAGAVPPVDIYTPEHDFGTQREKQLAAMYFRGNRITGSMLQMRYSDDDFSSWSNFRDLDMGQKRPSLTNCGSFYRRAWHLRHQSPTPFRIKTTDLQLDIGTL